MTKDIRADPVAPPREAGHAALQVYADALMARGDIRGDHIALMLGGHPKQAATLRGHHRETFYGPVSGWHVRSRHRLADVGTHPKARFEVHWRSGFIDTLRVVVTQARADELIAFLNHPSCTRLRILILAGTQMYGLGERIRAAGPIPSLERLHIGDFAPTDIVGNEADLGDWAELDTLFPNLRHLAANGVYEIGPLPKLKTLQVARELGLARVDWGPTGRLGNLEMARLSGTDAWTMLERTDLTSLRDLRVGREHGTSFVAALARRPELMARLEVLGFQRVDMRQTVDALLEVLPAMTRLGRLYVPRRDAPYFTTLSTAFPGIVHPAPPETPYTHFFREIGEPALGVIDL